MIEDFKFDDIGGYPSNDMIGDMALENSYQIVTGNVSLEEVIELMDGYLIFNTFDYDEQEVKDELIDYYLEIKDFDRCRVLQNLKEFKIYEYESDRAEAED